MAQYPNSGKLSANRYKDAPNKPDMVGELTMDRSALRTLLEETDSDDIVIKLGAANTANGFVCLGTTTSPSQRTTHMSRHARRSHGSRLLMTKTYLLIRTGL